MRRKLQVHLKYTAGAKICYFARAHGLLRAVQGFEFPKSKKILEIPYHAKIADTLLNFELLFRFLPE